MSLSGHLMAGRVDTPLGSITPSHDWSLEKEGDRRKGVGALAVLQIRQRLCEYERESHDQNVRAPSVGG